MQTLKALAVASGFAALLCSLKVQEETGAAGDSRLLFCIGTPDASPAEFGLAADTYRRFSTVFPKPVLFEVGRSSERSWPFVHPAPRDKWAGGRVHPFSIIFNAKGIPPVTLYLHIGIAAGHPTEPSVIRVHVNGKSLGSRPAPKGAVDLIFDPLGQGIAAVVTFPIPPVLLTPERNQITICLEKGSWIIYDYIALSKSGKPPALRKTAGRKLRKRLLSYSKEIVFVTRKLGPDPHWYANIGYYAEGHLKDTSVNRPGYHRGMRVTYRRGGKLCVLDLETGAVRTLINDPSGGVRDPAVHYDGQTILFAYRRGESPYYHLYTIKADGTGLRQLTSGPYDDFEPCWLPDGGIVFVSTRCKRWVNCWVTQVATLYRCNADGGDIRQISANIEHDNTPWVLPDGRILYQRWEYVDRSQVHYHHLWTTNPDGTCQMVFYGNLNPGVVMIDAKPIPGCGQVVAIFSPGHGRREHDGAVVVIDPELGPDDPKAARYIKRQPRFRDPWAFDQETFIAASGDTLVALDRRGRMEVLYRLPEADRKAGFQCHEPRPLVPRKRERIIPPRVDLTSTTGRFVLADVYRGRNMKGVKRGEIKKLLVLESLSKPINYTGGMDPLTYGGSFTLERVLGTVPVEPDGSAYFEAPALRPLIFVALDEKDLSVKRMQSFATVQPGEILGCVGCHERRTEAVFSPRNLLALRRPASVIKPIKGYPDVFDFPRDIQPILDDLCVDCHGYEKTSRGGPYAGKVILTGDRGPMFSHSYFTMTVKRLFSDGRNLPRSNYPPRALGSSASRILRMLDGSHYGVRATERQKTMLRLWIETGAPYPGTYGALGSGCIGGYRENIQINVDWEWPTTRAGAEVIGRRCASCHKGEKILPRSLSDERGVSFWNFSLEDPRLKLSRHIVFNLSRPEKSLLLLAPLARKAGGFGLCKPSPVFASRSDRDWEILLRMVEAGKEYLQKIKRFDMPGFRPPEAYIREMKRFGILPADWPPEAHVDTYALDRAYWRSLWYKPLAVHSDTR